MGAPRGVPKTIYGDIKVKRRRTTNPFIVIGIIIVILALAYFGFYKYTQMQYKRVPITYVYGKGLIDVLEKGGKIEKGGEILDGHTLIVPLEARRVIFTLGKDCSLRLAEGTRIKLVKIVKHKKTGKIYAEIFLQIGKIWVERGSKDVEIVIRSRLGRVTPFPHSDVEVKLTGLGIMKVLAWKEGAKIRPFSSSEDFTLDRLTQTEVNPSGSMAEPFDIVEKDMNVWEAWNLSVSMEDILKDKVATYKEAFIKQRKRLGIKGGFQGKVKLTSDTIISGGREVAQWQGAAVSDDGNIVIYYRENKAVKTKNKELKLNISVRNNGTRVCKDLIIQAQAFDKKGNIVGSEIAKVDELPPMESKDVEILIASVPKVYNYKLQFLLQGGAEEEWMEANSEKEDLTVEYKTTKKEIKKNKVYLTIEVRNNSDVDAKEVKVMGSIIDPEGFTPAGGKDVKTIKGLRSKEKRTVKMTLKGYTEGSKIDLSVNAM